MRQLCLALLLLLGTEGCGPSLHHRGPLILDGFARGSAIETAQAFEQYLRTYDPRYFALSKDGRFYWYTWCSKEGCPPERSPRGLALNLCNPAATEARVRDVPRNPSNTCMIFASGKKIVWDGPAPTTDMARFIEKSATTSGKQSLDSPIKCHLSDGVVLDVPAKRCREIRDAEKAKRAVTQSARAVPSSSPEAKSPTPAQPLAASRETVRSVQRNLAVLGYDSGTADGVAGRKTRAAVSNFQRDHNLPVTGEPSKELEMALRVVVAGREKFARHEPERPKLEKYGSASGFVVSGKGHVLTNDHVVDDCREVHLPLNVTARLVARDEENDLALLQDADSSRSSATFGQGRGARPGDDVVVAGYPLQGVLTSDLSITTGTVSALAGPGNDRRYLQITAPVQPGNSGGPLLDLAGNVVGVVVGKLDALMVAGLTGDIPQNVNFAISAWTVRSFLDAYNVPYETAPPEPRLTASEVAAEAQDYTVLLECWR